MSASGIPIKVLGQRFPYSLEINIVSSKSRDVILGLDFMKFHKAWIEVAHDTTVLGEKGLI